MTETQSTKDRVLRQDKFQMVLTGKIVNFEEKQYLETASGKKFKINRLIPTSLPQLSGNWQVVPTTNNQGEIVNVIVEKLLTSDELRTLPAHLIIDSGRIIEIAKNKTFIKVKLKRHQRKDIKLTILSSPTEIKIRQLWRILCQEKEGHLHCIEAEYLSD